MSTDISPKAFTSLAHVRGLAFALVAGADCVCPPSPLSAGSSPPEELIDSPLVEFVYLPTPLGWVAGLPKVLFLVFAPLKVAVGAWGLLYALLWRVREAPGYVFVQVSEHSTLHATPRQGTIIV